jgi:hypothetical protein
MKTVIVSDRFHSYKHRRSFREGYSGSAEIHRWAEAPTLGVDDVDVLVLDLELDGRYLDVITEATNKFRERTRLTGNKPAVSKIREQFEHIEQTVTNHLEAGNIIIGLLAVEKETRRTSSHAWLSRLQAIEQTDHPPRETLEVSPSTDDIRQYFDYVQQYEHGLRLNENTITDPELLAAHRLDSELAAVSFNEYRDRDENRRRAPGRIVLLPQPTEIEQDFTGIVGALESLGRYYWERVEKEALLDEHNQIDLEAVISNGESETIEFKRQIPPDGQKLAEEIAGLSNRGGGVLVVGVSDDGDVVGISEIDSAEERVSDQLSTLVEPILNLDVSKHVRNGPEVLLIDVPSAGRNPRSVDGKYHLRIGTTCQELSDPELMRLFI